MHNAFEGLKTCSYAEFHTFQMAEKRLSNLIWGCQHSLLLVIAQVWFSLKCLHRMWRASVGLLLTNVRGRKEQAAMQRPTLWRSTSWDSTTRCYKRELPWKPDWVGLLGEWQRGFDMTSEGQRWQCFIDWIICWVTQDKHGVTSPEEEQRDQIKHISYHHIKYHNFNYLILFNCEKWFAELFWGSLGESPSEVICQVTTFYKQIASQDKSFRCQNAKITHHLNIVIHTYFHSCVNSVWDRTGPIIQGVQDLSVTVYFVLSEILSQKEWWRECFCFQVSCRLNFVT